MCVFIRVVRNVCDAGLDPSAPLLLYSRRLGIIYYIYRERERKRRRHNGACSKAEEKEKKKKKSACKTHSNVSVVIYIAPTDESRLTFQAKREREIGRKKKKTGKTWWSSPPVFSYSSTGTVFFFFLLVLMYEQYDEFEWFYGATYKNFFLIAYANIEDFRLLWKKKNSLVSSSRSL